jgi:hypothetical protein
MTSFWQSPLSRLAPPQPAIVVLDAVKALAAGLVFRIVRGGEVATEGDASRHVPLAVFSQIIEPRPPQPEPAGKRV